MPIYRKQIIPDEPLTYEEKLVRTHGELVDRTTAGKILNVNRDTVRNYINSGYFQAAPNGDVIVRSLAQWIYSNQRPVRPQKLVVIP
jgi:hypothetical protein